MSAEKFDLLRKFLNEKELDDTKNIVQEKAKLYITDRTKWEQEYAISVKKLKKTIVEFHNFLSDPLTEKL